MAETQNQIVFVNLETTTGQNGIIKKDVTIGTGTGAQTDFDYPAQESAIHSVPTNPEYTTVKVLKSTADGAALIGDTTIDVQAGDGALFSALDVISPVGSSELIRVDSISTDELTVTRGFNGTTQEDIADLQGLRVVQAEGSGNDYTISPLTGTLGQHEIIFEAGSEPGSGEIIELTYMEGVRLFVSDPSPVPNVEQIERTGPTGSLDSIADIAIPTTQDVTWTQEMRGHGTDPTQKPECFAFFEAAGYKAVIGGSSVAFAPAATTAEKKSITIAQFLDGTVHFTIGAVATGVINLPPGNIGTIDATYRGRFTSVYDGPLPIGLPLNIENVPPAVQSGQLVFQGYAQGCYPEVSIDMGNDIQNKLDFNSPAGIARSTIASRKPLFSLQVQATTEAEHNFWGRLESGDAAAMTFTVGTISAKRYSFTAPKAKITNIAVDDAAGSVVWALDGQLQPSAATNDAMTFTFD